MRLALLDHLARRHHGLISQQAAASLGLSRSSWYRAIASGQLEQLYPNVARVWGSPDTFEQRALAAVWAVGGSALASHRTSATLWGVERPSSDPIDVLLPSRARHSLPSGVVIHRPNDRLDLRPIWRKSIPTTNPLRMLLDLGAVDPGAVENAMMDLLSAKIVSPSALQGALVRHSKKGRHGVVALRAALEGWLGEELPPDSRLEAAFGKFTKAFRLPPVAFHAIVAGYEVDFLVVDTTLVIECDGWATHGLQRDQFEFDRTRAADLIAAGYSIFPTTWRQVRKEPDLVAHRLRRVLERVAPDVLARASCP